MSSVVSKEVVSNKEAASYLSFWNAFTLGLKIYFFTAIIAAIPAALSILLTMNVVDNIGEGLMFGLMLIGIVNIAGIVPACLLFAMIYLPFQRNGSHQSKKAISISASLLTVLLSFVGMFSVLAVMGGLIAPHYVVAIPIYLIVVVLANQVLLPKEKKANYQSLKNRYENIF